MKSDDLIGLSPDKLYALHEKLKLIGHVLGQLALLSVVCDDNASSTAKAAAGKTLTQTGEDPQVITERLKQSQFAEMSPDELKTYISDLQKGDLTALEGEVDAS